MTGNSQTCLFAARVVGMAHQDFNEQLHPREGTGAVGDETTHRTRIGTCRRLGR